MVTQAPAGHQPLSQHPQKVPDRREVPAPLSAAVPPSNAPLKAPLLVPASSVTQPQQKNTSLPPSQESSLPQQQVPVPETSQLQVEQSPEPAVTQEESEPSPQPLNLSGTSSPCSHLLDFQISAEEALLQPAQIKTRDIDDILKEVIEEEREKAARAKDYNQPEAILGVSGRKYYPFLRIY